MSTFIQDLGQMRRYALRDDQWDRVIDLLPGKQGDRGATGTDNRHFIEAVLFRYRPGVPWRDVKEHFGDYHVIYTRHMSWSRKGVRERGFKALNRDAANEYVIPALRQISATGVPFSPCLMMNGF